ncbi:outer membrane beta-barrel protein [Photorhabdus stackebrandtii]|uniref:Outer membrane protein beta-barrel domain-containing protein n=1 Tax=Photorhabdus stackebrandtii TaxID=1123042 RepID=A0A7X5TK09_9GAMM|nr:hypothetical protein [Photorhabdus stackebrandtii]
MSGRQPSNLLTYGKAKYSDYVDPMSDSKSKTSVSYGLGLQFNLMPNWTIDISYEYSKLDELKIVCQPHSFYRYGVC